ncbi:hypothetical protein [Magnetofaba australis]|uniref:FecR protein domain-containing protein n=1 Tax=Magnetofaba australis IT-1 TaxID=1434232 RepID=A0A1Y2K7W5_9PROT|nr:hypothetical protein [Magnetofaba australis]OSM06772.1 hypothetical protein MAIT1_00367 [Magnetofaba australis IT-1]
MPRAIPCDNPARREWMKRLTAGVAAGGISFWAATRIALADHHIHPGMQGIIDAHGDVRVNGQPAQKGASIKQGDVVATGPRSRATFVVGGDVFLMRPNSEVTVSVGEKSAGGASTTNRWLSGFKLKKGGILSAFSKGPKRTLTSTTATLGVRGTALYMQTMPNGATYFCPCYGTIDVADSAGRQSLTVNSIHHDAPLFIYGPDAPMALEKAPMLNHTDAELMMIEALASRQPPFVQHPLSHGMLPNGYYPYGTGHYGGGYYEYEKKAPKPK